MDGALNPGTRIIGYARSAGDDASLRERLGEAVREYVSDFDEDSWAELAGRITYLQGDYDDAEGYRQLALVLEQTGLANRVFYTATPPSTYAGIVRGLAEAGLAEPPADGSSRIVIEKPFGDDLESATALNELLGQ